MLRVLKLMRIIRASRIFSRWQDHISLSFAYASLIRFLLMTLVLAHWLACLWGFIGLEEGNESDDWGDAGQPLWEGYLARQSWKYKARVLEAGPWETYAMALYVALNNIFGGSCEINPANFVEFYAQCIMLLIGSSVWAYVIGSACGVIATLDPALIEYRQTMDELNYFVRDQSMPAELTVKLRGYFRNTMHVIRSRRYEQLLQKMSSRLRGDAAYRMSGRIFAQVRALAPQPGSARGTSCAPSAPPFFGARAAPPVIASSRAPHAAGSRTGMRLAPNLGARARRLSQDWPSRSVLVAILAAARSRVLAGAIPRPPRP